MKTAVSVSVSYQQSGLVINLSNQRRPKRTRDRRATVLCWDLPWDWPLVLKEDLLFCYFCFVALLSGSDASNPNSSQGLPREPVSVLPSFLFIYSFVVALSLSHCSAQGATLRYAAQVWDCNGLSCAPPARGAQSSAVAARRLSSGSLVANLPGLTIEPMSPTLAGRFLSTVPPRKTLPSFLSLTFPSLKTREFPELGSISLLLTHFIHVGLYLLIPCL